MILIEENPRSNIISYLFRNQYKKFYLNKYYRNREAQEKNRPSWFKYITSIARHHNGDIEIFGAIGSKRFIWYPMKEAITKYNKECKKRFQT